MTHIVIHDDVNGVTQYRQFDDLGNAVAFLEELRNTAGVEDAKLYALDEVVFEVKPYYKVEVVGEAPSVETDEPVAAAPTEPAEAVEPAEAAEPAPAPEPEPAPAPEVLPTAEDVSFVEAAMQAPIETIGTELLDTGSDFAPQDHPEPSTAPGGDARRGLFGR